MLLPNRPHIVCVDMFIDSLLQVIILFCFTPFTVLSVMTLLTGFKDANSIELIFGRQCIVLLRVLLLGASAVKLSSRFSVAFTNTGRKSSRKVFISRHHP